METSLSIIHAVGSTGKSLIFRAILEHNLLGGNEIGGGGTILQGTNGTITMVGGVVAFATGARSLEGSWRDQNRRLNS